MRRKITDDEGKIHWIKKETEAMEKEIKEKLSCDVLIYSVSNFEYSHDRDSDF